MEATKEKEEANALLGAVVETVQVAQAGLARASEGGSPLNSLGWSQPANNRRARLALLPPPTKLSKERFGPMPPSPEERVDHMDQQNSVISRELLQAREDIARLEAEKRKLEQYKAEAGVKIKKLEADNAELLNKVKEWEKYFEKEEELPDNEEEPDSKVEKEEELHDYEDEPEFKVAAAVDNNALD